MVTRLVSFCQLDTNSVIQEEDTSFERMTLSDYPVHKSVGYFPCSLIPFYMCMDVFLLNICLCTKDRKGTGGTYSCNPRFGCWESNSSSLGEQVLLIAELFLHSLWGFFLFNDWCGKNQKVSSARSREQASRQHYSLTSASASASRVMTFLSSCHDFPQWWTVTWKCKANNLFPPKLHLVMILSQ